MEDLGTSLETGSFPMPERRALFALSLPWVEQKLVGQAPVLEGPPGFGFLPGSPTDSMAGSVS